MSARKLRQWWAMPPGQWMCDPGQVLVVLASECNEERMRLATKCDFLAASRAELLAALLRVRGHVCGCDDAQALEQLDAAIAKAAQS